MIEGTGAGAIVSELQWPRSSAMIAAMLHRFFLEVSMTAFTVHASKSGGSVQTVRISPAMTVAKACALQDEGWMVHITDVQGRRFDPVDFDLVLALDRKPASPDTL